MDGWKEVTQSQASESEYVRSRFICFQRRPEPELPYDRMAQKNLPSYTNASTEQAPSVLSGWPSLPTSAGGMYINPPSQTQPQLPGHSAGPPYHLI